MKKIRSKNLNASTPASLPTHPASPQSTSVDTAWVPLYRIGGVAAILLLGLMVFAIFVFIINPPPTTVVGYFTRFQHNKFLGLLALDLPYMVSQLVMGILMLTLCVALRRANPSLIALALTSGLTGLAIYFASNPAFGMLTLSDQYATATTDMQRSQFEAAGQAIMANYTGTAYTISYVLGGMALLIIALVMLRSTLFSKGIAWIGLMMGGMSLIPASAGTVGLVFAFGSLVPLVIWLVLIARRLFQLGQLEER
jgi:Domain of unknown function (DUF4386)